MKADKGSSQAYEGKFQGHDTADCVQEQSSWKASELAKLMELAVPKLRMGAIFWINQGTSLLYCKHVHSSQACAGDDGTDTHVCIRLHL